MQGRVAVPEIIYNGKNITTKLAEYLTGFSYTDTASGECDSIKIKLSDRDMNWMGDWMPKKGDKLSAEIFSNNWDKDGEQRIFKCGVFVLDDLSYSGRPLSCNIEAVSIPANEGFKTTVKTKTWNSVSVQKIASEIAENAGVNLHYEAGDIPIKCIEQSKQNDCEFIYKTCKDYGLAMKVYGDKIVIFDEGRYSEKPVSREINEKDMLRWSYNTTLTGTYTGARMTYTDGKKDTDLKIEVGSGTRILEINEKADNLQDAELKATAKLREENKKAVRMSITMMGTDSIVASMTVAVTGLKNLSGKYYVDQVTHSLDSEYKINLELHKVEERLVDKNVAGAAESESTSNYTVKSGDNLWMLAKQFLGKATRYNELYELNKEIIETEAKRRGKKDSNKGHWIYPGTILIIPAKGE